VLAAILDVLPR
jgi:hypothetical protein